MNNITISNATESDVALARHGFVPYKETATPAPSMPDAKQICYRRCQGDEIIINDDKIVITFDNSITSEFVNIDTQQDCIQFSNQLWLTYDELIAFINKVKEL